MYFSRSARNTATTQSGEDRRFFDVFTSLRPYGGMQSDDELRCLQAASRSGFSLKSALLERRAFVLTWRHRLWVPMFQLNQPSLDLSPEVEAVVSELSTVLDGFELAEWFVTPNQWMRDERFLVAM
jgi:hypothetical protein